MTEDHRLIKSAKSERDGNVSEATIPADIRSNAALAVGPWADPRGELVSRIARAILAERDRCAKIAEKQGRNNLDWVYAAACLDVSEAIRRR